MNWTLWFASETDMPVLSPFKNGQTWKAYTAFCGGSDSTHKPTFLGVVAISPGGGNR